MAWLVGVSALLAFPAVGTFGQENLAAGTAPNPAEGRELIGRPAPEWSVTNWINSPPLSLRALKGKVVLVRWWTAPGCEFCVASAPALDEFDRLYRDKGLVVIGFYHHKAPTPLDPAEVKEETQRFGFQFPVAVDPEWRTLRRWWLAGHDRRWTSVSFLIDRKGIIRHVHPGGAYVKGDPGYEELKRKIEQLLSS